MRKVVDSNRTVDVNQPPVLALTSAAVTTTNYGGKATVTIVATGGTVCPYSYTFNSTQQYNGSLQTYLQELTII
jgi:hypothetical protein